MNIDKFKEIYLFTIFVDKNTLKVLI